MTQVPRNRSLTEWADELKEFVQTLEEDGYFLYPGRLHVFDRLSRDSVYVQYLDADETWKVEPF